MHSQQRQHGKCSHPLVNIQDLVDSCRLQCVAGEAECLVQVDDAVVVVAGPIAPQQESHAVGFLTVVTQVRNVTATDMTPWP